MRIRHLGHWSPLPPLAAAVFATACASAPATRDDAGPPAVESRSGMVVCASAPACDAGAAMLARGGNAVDAAVATAFAMAVTYPAAGNIGGGGFLVVRRDTHATTFDFREKAPLRATPTMYLDSTGEINRSLTATGHLAVGVPGTVHGLERAHRRFGRLPWREVVEPAVALARDGFVLTPDLARSLSREVARGMRDYPASISAYGRADGREWAAGDRLVLPDLGRSLDAIAREGSRAFYHGWIADSIAADMARNGGIIEKRDLESYESRERAPIRGTFRGHTVYSMPPPSSGGVALVETLNILEALEIWKHKHWSPQTIHYTVEAMRRAFHDRARFLGDPDFVKVPVDSLTSKTYARSLAASIGTRATPSVTLARDILADAAESEETTHISVMDSTGMAVALTYTLEGGFGSHVVARGTGILLNNEMGDFNRKPGSTTQRGDIGTDANVIAPGKRMLSSMTPTIVTGSDGSVMVTGSPGGRTIINTVVGMVLNRVAFGMDVRAAVDAPRLHHQWLPDTLYLESRGAADALVSALTLRGHAVRTRTGQGDAHTIYWDPVTRTARGANDLRSADSKVSVPRAP